MVGAGFAALTAIRRLRRRLPAADITLAVFVPEFVYLPSLVRVPSGLRRGAELRHDLRPLLEALRLMPRAKRGFERHYLGSTLRAAR